METDINVDNSRLSRFLDGDLSGTEATDMIRQISESKQLRDELEALRTVRSQVRNLRTPRSSAAETMRMRVHARFRAEMEANAWNPSARISKKVSRNFWPSTAVTFAAAATVVGIYFLLPGPSETMIVTGGKPETVTVVPSNEEMSLFFDLHDSQGATYSRENNAVSRNHTAQAQAALLDRADSVVVDSL